MLRSLLSLAITVSLPTQSAASPQAAPRSDDAQKSPIIRTATRVVNVNVVVADREGRPVKGLSKDDFQIFDNGQPAQIAFFSTRDGMDATSAALDPLAPGEYSNDPRRAGITDEGLTLILFDTVNTAYLSQAYSLEKIRILLRQLEPEDRVGIYVLNRDGLKVVYPPEQRASLLLEAMLRYDEAHNGKRDGKAAAHAERSTGLEELDDFLRGKDDRQPMRRCVDRLPITIAAFQEITRRTTGVPGRKAVIWVTEQLPFEPSPWGYGNAVDLLRGVGGFCGDYDPHLIVEEPVSLRPLSGSRRTRPVDSGDSGSTKRTDREPAFSAAHDRGLGENDQFDLLVRLFTRNNIALYPVSAEGLQTVRLFGPAGMDSTAFISDPQTMQLAASGTVDAVANVASHQSMEEMARRTGGRAYYDRNDLETGIRSALDDRKYGYDMAYYPDHDHWNGDWHKIEVKVNRPGVTVLAREGYFAFPELKLLPPKARKQLIEEIAASPLEDTEIPMTVKLPPPDSLRSATVEARVFLDPQTLFSNHQGDAWKSDFKVLFFQLTAKNNILDVTTETVQLTLTDARYNKVLQEGFDMVGALQLKPGAALLYVIVHDKRSDAVGSVRIPLDQYKATP